MRPSSFVVTGNARFTNKIIFSLLNALTRPECSSNLQMCTIRRFFMQSHVLSFSKNYSSSASIECACFLCDASFHISLYYLNYHISGFRRFCSLMVNTWNAHALQILTIGRICQKRNIFSFSNCSPLHFDVLTPKSFCLQILTIRRFCRNCSKFIIFQSMHRHCKNHVYTYSTPNHIISKHAHFSQKIPADAFVENIVFFFHCFLPRLTMRISNAHFLQNVLLDVFCK